MPVLIHFSSLLLTHILYNVSFYSHTGLSSLFLHSSFSLACERRPNFVAEYPCKSKGITNDAINVFKTSKILSAVLNPEVLEEYTGVNVMKFSRCEEGPQTIIIIDTTTLFIIIIYYYFKLL